MIAPPGAPMVTLYARLDTLRGSKHMLVSRPSLDGAATVAREYAGAGRVRHVVPRPGGGNVECLPLADAFIGEIDGFMKQSDLL